MKSVLLLGCSALLLSPVALTLSAQDVHGVHAPSMDKTVQPGDNFYRYANGTWIAKTEIPADRTSLTGFSLLADVVNKRVAGIIEEAVKANTAPGTEKRKIADLYASYMDEQAIDAHGMAALKPHLKEIAAISNQRELATALGHTLRADTDALNNTNFHTPNLFGIWIAPGFNDPDHYTPYLMQGGLQLPDRAYYLTDSERMKTIREKYVQHISAMLKLAGYDNTDKRSEGILELEHSIAEHHLSLAEDENIAKANNVWQKTDFAKNAPGLDWNAYFAAADLAQQPDFIVWQPTAVTAEAAIVAATPIDTWKDYLAFHLIEQYSVAISTPLADERFNFAGKILTGAQQQRPREQRAVALVNGVLGDAVGQLYAARYFTPADKAKVEEMVHNLLTTFHARLENLTWMTPGTKAEALRKLGTLQVSIGYTDHWRSYEGLNIEPGDLFGNLWRASLFDYHYSLARIGKPTDRKEWTMTPQTVNAVNLPLDNGLNFPAAIFGPPFFDPKAPDAVNYGAIGTVIGHEISHTFDSEGAAFDSQGKVRNWWTDADRAHFDASIEALAKQYDTYAPFPDLHLNGHQTLGENIADLAGITASYDAWKTSLHGKPAPVVGGLTGDQQFFIGYAQSEGGKAREAALRQQVLTDPHSPGEFRADTVRNLDAWYAAFDVKPGQTLYLAPADRVHIW
ncbi:M13 family metallopeptidase [Granulicella mallensis]|uniref:Endothelin-converting enzyme/putative endopeptidase n=1 Tax=Granulicella mallensis TaxID=940614 RepID=A0A7W8EAD5_9BACT|nr:M13 family metallopeptidase [Granulicella mallensis]MBB5064697.1 endothelin-converting enzyme/putative endopeptidase [Granulicella mallensis]